MVKRPFTVLGTVFSTDLSQMPELNFVDKIGKIKKNLFVIGRKETYLF